MPKTTEETQLVISPYGNNGIEASTPMQMLAVAVSRGAGIDELGKLMDLQERWEKTEARKAFVDAISAFKAHSIQILRDKTNTQYNSKYVSLGQLVGTVTPFLSQHGLSCRWDIDQAAGIKVTCVMTHTDGHSESVSMVVPPDDSGKKNPIQQIKSAITYGKVCTFESICGLASSDGNLDDDGNGAYASNGELTEQLEYIASASTPEELKSLYKTAYEMFEANPAALKQIIAARKVRKEERAW